jgi:transposase-like protein
MVCCSRCLTSKVIAHYDKQRYYCKLCFKQFVADSTHYISEEKRQAIARCLRERLSLRSISRVFQVSLTGC